MSESFCIYHTLKDFIRKKCVLVFNGCIFEKILCKCAFISASCKQKHFMPNDFPDYILLVFERCCGDYVEDCNLRAQFSIYFLIEQKCFKRIRTYISHFFFSKHGEEFLAHQVQRASLCHGGTSVCQHFL